MEGKKIKLTVINESVLTFDADDYMTLRTVYRMIGKLMGCAVPYPRNVTISGLPAIYTEFQTKLMLEKGIAELENGKELNESPSDEIKEAFNLHLNKLRTEAERPYIDARLKAMKAKMDTIIKGKRAKLIKKGLNEDEIQIKPEDILSEEEKRLKSSISSSLTYIQVPTQHPFLNTKTCFIGNFPVTNLTKYKVFCDLWHKGYYITNGESFGGDFLTYNDDPMYFHASQIVHVIDRKEKFDIYFPVSCTRLAVSVKKKCVFAYVDDDDDDKVIYQTMLWVNPKLKEMYSYEKIKND